MLSERADNGRAITERIHEAGYQTKAGKVRDKGIAGKLN